MEKEFLIISDIHGRGFEFRTLVRKLINRKDEFKFILLGDYVGYGSKNLETIKVLKWLKENTDCTILKGNWEDMFYNYFRNSEHYSINIFFKKGGLNIVKEMKKDEDLLDWYLDLIEDMKLYHIETINKKKYIFTHAGLNLNRLSNNCLHNIDELMKEYQMKIELMWYPNFFQDAKKNELVDKFPFAIVAGHIPTRMLNEDKSNTVYVYKNNIIGVDLGASSKNGKLGFINLSKDSYPTLDEKLTTPSYKF